MPRLLPNSSATPPTRCTSPSAAAQTSVPISAPKSTPGLKSGLPGDLLNPRTIVNLSLIGHWNFSELYSVTSRGNSTGGFSAWAGEGMAGVLETVCGVWAVCAACGLGSAGTEGAPDATWVDCVTATGLISSSVAFLTPSLAVLGVGAEATFTSTRGSGGRSFKGSDATMVTLL